MKYENSFERNEAVSTSSRAEFIKKCYLNLAASFAVFICLEALLMNWSGAFALADKMLDGYNWAFVMIAFFAVSWFADKWAHSSTSKVMQYVGLYLYVFIEAIIFLPLLLLANILAPDTIAQAGILTFALTAGITAYALISKENFSYLGGFLMIASFVIFGVVICAVFFSWQLGLWFSLGMVAFSAIVLLYQTSVIIHEYNEDQYVGAALGLFAAIALMFWYILRALLLRDD